MNNNEINLIDIKQVLRTKAPSLAKKMPSFLVNYLIRIVHQDELNKIIQTYKNDDGVDFMLKLIDYFQLTLHVIHEENIPQDTKKYIFACNHPLGGLDGICLSALLGKKYEGNIRYLVNDLLLFIPNLRSIFVPINKHGAQPKDNVKLINNTFASEHQIITFPAGLCSRKKHGKIEDLEWQPSFIKKAVQYKKDIVPVFFEGENSNFFYNLSRIRTKLGIKQNIEMLYLSDEMFKSKGKTFNIHFGKPIPWQTFDKSQKASQWAQWMKQTVYKLNDIDI